jgi:hypothetical protein
MAFINDRAEGLDETGERDAFRCDSISLERERSAFTAGGVQLARALQPETKPKPQPQAAKKRKSPAKSRRSLSQRPPAVATHANRAPKRRRRHSSWTGSSRIDPEEDEGPPSTGSRGLVRLATAAATLSLVLSGLAV